MTPPLAQTHSTEPWALGEYPHWITDATGKHVAAVEKFTIENGVYHANAARIVSCINGCEGLNPAAFKDCVEALAAAEEHLGAIYLCEKREAFVKGLIANPPPVLTKIVTALTRATTPAKERP